MAGVMISDIDTSAFADLAKAWKRAPDIVLDELEKAISVSTGMLHAEIIDNTPVGASGGSGAGLSGSISYVISRGAADVTGVVGTPNPYAVPVEMGTKPHMPPLEPIIAWVQAKLGIEGEEEAEGIAQRIAWKIKAHGTEGQFMFRDSLDRLRPDIERSLTKAAETVLQRLEAMG